MSVARWPAMGKTRDITRLEAQLRQAIADSGMSPSQVGALCGVDPGQLSRFVRGERTLILRSADKIARLLGLRRKGSRFAESQNAGQASGQPRVESSFLP